MNLYLAHYGNTDFKNTIEDDLKTIYLFVTNHEKDKKSVEQLVQCSKKNKVPVVQVDCWFDTNKLQTGMERHAIHPHFNMTNYVKPTDICVGVGVAIKIVNHLPEIGLFNGAIGTGIDIVYRDSPTGLIC